MNLPDSLRLPTMMGWHLPALRALIEAQIAEGEAELKLRCVCPADHVDDMLDLANRRLAESRQRSVAPAARARTRAEALNSVIREICLGVLP